MLIYVQARSEGKVQSSRQKPWPVVVMPTGEVNELPPTGC